MTKRPWLLTLAAALLAVWIVFLGWLAWHSYAESRRATDNRQPESQPLAQ